ncbi:MAG: peptide chain release factor 1 [Deltaproteobacteria bacterium]
MFEKLAEVEARFEQIEKDLQDPAVSNDRDRLRQLMREHSELAEVVALYRQRRSLAEGLEEAEKLKDDSDLELREMAREEARALSANIEETDAGLKALLVPKDPLDQRNAIVEIRAGTGGEEAALFAADLLRMYLRYCEEKGWKSEQLNLSAGTMGGIKETTLLVSGRGTYGRLRREGGVHRVQRVPQTETQGRVHTSAVTVAVLPEAEELDVRIEDNDLRVDVYRSSGPGGQSVNTTDSAVRLTHVPSGLVVTCQDEKSQHKNKAKALKILRSRLFEFEEAKRQAKVAAERKAMVGTGDRSERIRTYNFPQGRVTDHRIGLTLYSLDRFIAGDMDEVLDAVSLHFQTEALKTEGGK